MTKGDLQELYKTNNDFKDYVDKYCTKHHIEKDEALDHLIVQAIATIYALKETT